MKKSNNRVNSDDIKRRSLSLTPLYAAGYAKRYVLHLAYELP